MHKLFIEMSTTIMKALKWVNKNLVMQFQKIHLLSLLAAPKFPQNHLFFIFFPQQPPYEAQADPEVEMFEVDLQKDTHGLGITIAGYVGGDNTPGR